jgi:myo-inositol 2-dehydrogenase/D-chiro-inositol 1-dehydrogenase
VAVRVGLIGAGGIGQSHIRVLSKLKNVEFAGVYDVDTEKAEKVAKTIDAKAYKSAVEVIDSDDMDALFVCSPQFARDDIEEAAARKGIHLFVEKPLGLDLETVRRKEQVINETGIINSSGYCLRYLDTVQKAKAYLTNKQVDMVMAYRFGGQHAPRWWRQLDQSGGQLVDQTTHQVDLIRFLVGEINEVYSQFARRSIQMDDPDATIYDVGTVALKLESGAVGNISNTCIVPQCNRSEIEIIGHHFYVQINGHSLKMVDDDINISETSRQDYYFEQDKRFIEAVESGSQNRILCSYSDALKTLEVTFAANRSAIEKNPIKL